MRLRHQIETEAPAGRAPAVGAVRVLTLLLALLLFCAGAGTVSAGQDHIVSRGILEDRGSELTIADVLTRDFAPAPAIITRGYTDSAHWIRLVVRPADEWPELVLRIRPSYLDEVVLYAPDPAHPGQWLRSVTGDRTSFFDRALRTVSLGFPLPAVPHEATYYLRLSTTSTSLLQIEATEAEDAHVRDLMLQVLHALCLGFMAWIFFWSLNEYVMRRDIVLALFSLNQFAFIIYGIFITGYAALLLPRAPPGLIDAGTSLMVCWTPLVSLVCYRALTAPFAPNRLVMRALDALIFVDLVALAMLMMGFTRAALQLNGLAIITAVPVFLLVAFTASREALPGRLILRSVFALQSLFLVVTIAPLIGLFPATSWNLDAMPLHGLISGALMFFLLQRRSRQLQRQGVEAELNLDLARRQLDLERNQRDLQNRFIAMLTHELKTPLSVVRIGLDTLKLAGDKRERIDNALDNMNAILERCDYADQLDQQQLQHYRQSCDVAALVAEAIARSPRPERLALVSRPVPAITSDCVLLAVLFGNLIDNALKYSPEDSRIEVDVAPLEDGGRPGVRLAIANLPGRAGLPDPDRVFAKFYRSAGAQSSSGSGLGLYIVRGIADLLGGRIVYRAVDGKARFALWLPC